MRLENCKMGMKVITTGRTARNVARDSSECCKGEKEIGYVTLGYKFKDKIEVKYERYVTEFYFDQIHPYWGDK